MTRGRLAAAALALAALAEGGCEALVGITDHTAAPIDGGGQGGAAGTGTGGKITTGAGGAGGAHTGAGGSAIGSGGTPVGAGGSGGGGTGAGGTLVGTGGLGAGGRIGTGGRSDTGGSGVGGRSDTGGSGVGGRSDTGGATGSGGTGAGGTGTAGPSYYIGADITDQETASDAMRATLLGLLKGHGFNYIRLRTFVDPKASDGYDKTSGFDDLTHTVAFGKQVKDAGLGLLVDFHYSDNWADPGKQCVPVAWQGLTELADLATAVHDYTKNAITMLIAGGARPDMVQIGNEITPGMLIHRCDASGQPTGNNPITGSISNWTNLGTLLKAGINGVKEVDTGILIALHIDRGGDAVGASSGSALSASIAWITNAMNQGVAFDVFGESTYQAYQGDPNNVTTTKAGWTNTFGGLSTRFPNLKLMSAEYGPMQREINDVVFNLSNKQGIGTFNWEPTTQGAWNTGHDLLRRQGTTYTVQPDMALYDQMRIDYASRL